MKKSTATALNPAATDRFTTTLSTDRRRHIRYASRNTHYDNTEFTLDF